MKNLEILLSKSLFLDLASLREAKQGINCSISLSWTIIDLEMIFRELLCPADLTRAQTLCIHRLAEVIIVSNDEDLVFAVF